MKNTVVSKAKELKTIYQIRYLDRLGPFEKPEQIAVRSKKLFISQYKNNKSNLLIFDLESAKFLKQIDFGPKKIFKLVFSELLNSIIFSCVGEKMLYCMNLNEGKVENFLNELDSTALQLSAIKIFENAIFVLDSFAHKIRIYDFKGNLKNVLDFSGKFEFPLQFCLLDSERLLLSHYDLSFCRIRPAIFHKYQTTNLHSNANLAIYSLKTGELKELPRIPIFSKKPFLYYLDKDVSGNVFAGTLSHLYKLNSNLEIIFSVNLNQLIPQYQNVETIFPDLFITDNTLYLLEKRKDQSVFRFQLSS